MSLSFSPQMIEVLALAMRWFLVVLTYVGGFALFGLGVMSLLHKLVGKVLSFAAILEALREARIQGRAPIFRAWQRWTGKQ